MKRILVYGERLDDVTLQTFNGMIDTTPDNLKDARPDFAIDNLYDIMVSYIHDLVLIWPHLRKDTQMAIRKVLVEKDTNIKSCHPGWVEFLVYIGDK